MKLLTLCALPILLTGCKVEIQMPVNLSDFDKEEKSIQILGGMAIEVASCTESGTDMPSDDVFKLQKQIPYVFKGAEYGKCISSGFNSYVLFSLPANIDNSKDGFPVDNQIINLSFFPTSSGERNLLVYIPPKLRDSINNLIESNVHLDVDDIVLSVEINPEGKPISFTLIGAYLDNEPVQMGIYENNGGIFEISIPAYGMEQMLQTKDTTFTILMNTQYMK